MDELVTDEDLSETPPASIATEAIELIDAQAGLLVHASTNSSLKPTENEKKYKQRRRRLKRLLAVLEVKDPIPYDDLGAWNGYWQMNLPNWASRRAHVRDLVADRKAELENIRDSIGLVVPSTTAAPSWRSLEGRVGDLSRELERAGNKDDFQDVGRRSREILIDAAMIIARPDLLPEGEDEPKAGDATAWLGYFVDRYAVGSSQKRLRAFIRATWDLTQRVTHADVDKTEAYAAAQGTVLLVRVLQQLETRAS